MYSQIIKLHNLCLRAVFAIRRKQANHSLGSFKGGLKGGLRGGVQGRLEGGLKGGLKGGGL